MKTLKKAVIAMIAMLTMIGMMGAAHADADRDLFTAAAGAAVLTAGDTATVGALGTALWMVNNGNTYASDCPKERYNAPMVRVRQPGSNVITKTTACDYEAKKDRLVRVE